jgi:hypothetical protein
MPVDKVWVAGGKIANAHLSIRHQYRCATMPPAGKGPKPFAIPTSYFKRGAGGYFSMKLGSSIALFILATIMAMPANAAPTPTSQATIERIKAAILADDASELGRIDDRISYLPDFNEGPAIAPRDALNLLKGCQFQTINVPPRVGSLSYSCPLRKIFPPCTTGALDVMYYDYNGKTELALVEKRKFDGGCPPPPVPAMPAAFEPDIALSVAQSVIDGHSGEIGKLLSDKVRVVRAAKYANGSPEIEFSGNGNTAFFDQSKIILSKTGKPTSVSCDAAKSICQFTFTEHDRFLFAAIMTRNHQVEFIQFFYSTRAMILERLKQKP